MATRAILSVGLLISSVPFVVFSRVAEAIDLWDLKADIALCLRAVDSSIARPIPLEFIQSLVIAEDRRHAVHLGVDPVGILRAILVRMAGKGIQGASTIEQQFVRVITDSYERTIQRKIREQALAIAVSRRRNKAQIASAYLSVACYGARFIGASGLRQLCGIDLTACPTYRIHGAIARLKYPQPMRSSTAWERKLVRRAAYIACRMPSANRQTASTRLLTASRPI